MNVRQIKVEIEVGRLLMHNEQLADPLNEYTKALKEVTSLKKKTDEQHMEVARREFQGGLYFDDRLGPYVPSTWVMGALIAGARRTKNGKEVASFVEVAEDKIKLHYKGPRTREALFADKRFVDRRSVSNQMNRVMRTRPRFEDCTLEYTLQVFEGGPNTKVLEEALSLAGIAVGIGDGRPRLAGKFVVRKFEEI